MTNGKKSQRPTWPLLQALWVCLLLSSAACAPTLREPGLGLGDSGDSGNPDARFPDGGIGDNELALTRLAPGNGPFLGGNQVLVRGGGFVEGMTIEVGGRLVDGPDLDVVDSNRALILASQAPRMSS
jgi:hypothetical protein